MFNHGSSFGAQILHLIMGLKFCMKFLLSPSNETLILPKIRDPTHELLFLRAKNNVKNYLNPRMSPLTMPYVKNYLCPLGSFSPDPTPTPASDLHPTTLSGEPEPYEVFRNEISSSTLDSFAHGLTMTSVAYYYDTLCPLGSFSPDPTPTPASDLHPTTLSGEPEPYEVFRNEISSSTLDSFAPQSATVDYFSLDVSADAALEPTTPTPPPRSVSKADDEKNLELALESGWFRSNCKFKSPMLQLHKEILDFCEFLSPTPEEEALRHAAIDSVFEVIKYIWPSCRVEVFGSFRTGLYLPSSDIDVVILGSNIRTPQMGLQALSRALSQRGIAKKIQVIGKARVPIIKFVEKNSELSFDCSFDLDNGPKAADYIKDAIVKLPPLRPLCLIIKVFLQQRELNEVYSGGIGSYALLVMLIALLRNLNESQTCPEQNLGILLVNFFELYAKKLNTYDVGVSCNGKGTFFSKGSKGFLGKGFLISIQDPQTPDNDIGKSSFNYFQVKSAFKMAYSTLTNVKTIMSLGPKRSILGTIIRPDSVLIERKGGRNGDITFNGLLPGAGEPVPCDDRQDILCNWQMNEEDDDLTLPRDTEALRNGDPSPKKKRKSSRKVMSNGHAGKEVEESGYKEEKIRKRKKKRHTSKDE